MAVFVRCQLFRVFTPSGGCRVRLQADRWLICARIMASVPAWKRWRMSDLPPKPQAASLSSLGLPTDLTPEKIADSFVRTRTIPLFQFARFYCDVGACRIFRRWNTGLRLHMELCEFQCC